MTTTKNWRISGTWNDQPYQWPSLFKSRAEAEQTKRDLERVEANLPAHLRTKIEFIVEEA